MSGDIAHACQNDGMRNSGMVTLGGTSCVCWHERGILLQGPPGSGKSDLALRVIHGGGMLVADDVVHLKRQGTALIARARGPAGGDTGLIELRGQGIFRLPWREETEIAVMIRLVDENVMERLPEPSTVRLAGIEVPQFAMNGRAASAVARIATILACQRVA